jgi:hypothetical protein
MRYQWIPAAFAAALLLACNRQPAPELLPPASPAELTPSWALAIEDSARDFARTIATGISQQGPAGWRRFFAEKPAFFMVANGALVFPSSDSASRGVEQLTHVISAIELQWSDSVRADAIAPGLAMLAMPYHERLIDPAKHAKESRGYFTGLAEHGPDGWRLRNAHWSEVR